MELPLTDKILYKHVVIVHNEDHSSMIHQCNMFERARSSTNSRARMWRGSKRGNIRDVWNYDKYGKLVNWTTFESIRVRDRSDANRVNSKLCNGYIFLTDDLDSSTLNTLFSKLSNVEGVMMSIGEVNDPEIKHEQY